MLVSGWCLAVGGIQAETNTEAKPDKTDKVGPQISGIQTNSLGMVFVPV
jgi:hypothetical protein